VRRVLRRKLVFRVGALSMLIFCLVIFTRKNTSARMTAVELVVQNSTQKEPAILTAGNDVGSPLVVSSPRTVPSDPQSPEIELSFTNVSGKAIRAFAIKQNVEAGEARRSSVALYNLDLSNSELQPNQSLNEFSTYEVLSEKRHTITLSVAYVVFTDATSWGTDSFDSAQRIAGERAAGYLFCKGLLKDLNASDPTDVLSTIDAVAAKIEPPVDRSEEWKQGFRLGRISLIRRLKDAQNKRGLIQVNLELHQLAERFKGAE
jgi:hypothetical protein